MKYLRHFSLGIFLLAAFSAGINLAVDPFDIFGAPVVKGFNDAKSYGIMRFVKPLQAAARQPEVVILGSSRAQVGLDPDDVPGGGAYNLAIPGTTATELRAYGEHALTGTPAGTLLVGLDFFTFNDTLISRGSFETAVLGPYSLVRALPVTLFSYEALNRSRKTFRLSWKGERRHHRANGRFVMSPPPGTAEEAMLGSLAGIFSSGGYYRGLTRIDKSLAELDALLGAAAAKGVKVVTFVSPTHAALLEALDEAGLWPLYENWQRRLAAIAGRNRAVLWYFGGYTPLSTVALAESNVSFIDAAHFRPQIGRRMLAEMYNSRPRPSLGVRLEPANVEAHLVRQRQARDAYRAARAGDVARIRAAVKGGS